MLNIDNLRYEIAQQRVDYGWTIFKNHGLVKGDSPALIRDNSVPLERLASSSFPDARPEGFDIAEEIRRDLDNLELVLKGGYDPDTSSKKLTVRQSTIKVEEGELNCAHLAYNGILTPSAYHSLRRRRRTDLAGHYSLKAFAETFGISLQVVYDNFDHGQGILFGEYPTIALDKREKGGVGATAIQMLARAVDNVVLLAEVAEHVSAKYGTTDILASQKVYGFGNNPQGSVAEEDPYHDHAFNIFDLFEIYKVMDLRTLNAFANVLIRDRRLLETHFGTAEAAEKLSMNRRSARELIEHGSLSARQTSILPKEGTRKKPYLICDHDVAKYEERRVRLPLNKIEERLSRAGVISTKDSFFPYLKEKGLADDDLQGSKGSVAPEMVEELIATMRADGRFSLDYALYCKVMELEPRSEEALAQFQRDHDSFNGCKEAVAFISDNLDLTYNGVHLGDLDAREIDVEEVIREILQKNKAAIAGLNSRFGAVMEEGKIYVPATWSYFARQNECSDKYLENYRLRKRLSGQGLIKRMFGFFDFIELSDLLDVNTRLREYHDVLAETVGAQDMVGLTGFDRKSVAVCAGLGLIPGVRVGMPYSDRAVYRFTSEQVKMIGEKNRLISFRDIHSIAIYERILMTEDRLREHFHEFTAINPPEEAELKRHGNGVYNYNYAQAFVNHIRRKTGMSHEEAEQAALVLQADRKRADRLNPALFMARQADEMSFGELHNLALYCKTHNGNNLAGMMTNLFKDRFFALAAGKTAANCVEMETYAPQAIWGALQSYNLYSGQDLLEHFDQFVRKTFIPQMRGEYSQYGEISLNQMVGDDDGSALENFIADSSPSTDMLMEIQEGMDKITDALSRLDDEQRELIQLYYFSGLDEEAISARLNFEPGQVSELLEESIESMRKILS